MLGTNLLVQYTFRELRLGNMRVLWLQNKLASIPQYGTVEENIINRTQNKKIVVKDRWHNRSNGIA